MTLSIPPVGEPIFDREGVRRGEEAVFNPFWYRFFNDLAAALGRETDNADGTAAATATALAFASPVLRQSGSQNDEIALLAPFPRSTDDLQRAKSDDYRLAAVGTVALVAGTATILTDKIFSDSLVLLTVQTAAGTQGHLSVGTITDELSFVISSTSATETSTIAYFIYHPIA